MGLSAVMGFLRWDLKYSYGAYEKYYVNELGDAFRSDNQKRKQLVYAYGLHHEKRCEAALEPLTSLFRRSSTDEDRRAVVLGMALCMHELGRLEQAEQLYRQLLAFDPDYGIVLTNLGLMALEGGKYRDAEVLLGRAVELDEGNAHARLNLGSLFFRLGYYRRAIPLLERAAELEPRLVDSAATLARCYAIEEDRAQMAHWADLAIERGQDDGQLEKALNNTLAVLHDPADMPPETAAAYRSWRQRTGRESIICGLSPDAATRSYVGGEALGTPPTDGSGKPMRQLAAIYCEEFPGIGLQEEGLIRIFIATDSTWGMDPEAPNVQRNFRVLYDRDFSHLTPGTHPGGGAFPVRGKLRLRIHTRVMQPMPACDYRFREDFDDELCTEITDAFHRMGGYPCSNQHDPREDERYARYDQLLFQLDTMDWGQWGVSIGDGGCMKFCIPSDALSAGDFSDVLYWWD